MWHIMDKLYCPHTGSRRLLIISLKTVTYLKLLSQFKKEVSFCLKFYFYYKLT